MARMAPRQNPVRDFVKEAHKCGLEPVIKTTTLTDGTVTTEMRAVDKAAMLDETTNGIRPDVAKAIAAL